ncbi:catalase [Apiospora saccharicola]
MPKLRSIQGIGDVISSMTSSPSPSDRSRRRRLAVDAARLRVACTQWVANTTCCVPARSAAGGRGSSMSQTRYRTLRWWAAPLPCLLFSARTAWNRSRAAATSDEEMSVMYEVLAAHEEWIDRVVDCESQVTDADFVQPREFWEVLGRNKDQQKNLVYNVAENLSGATQGVQQATYIAARAVRTTLSPAPAPPAPPRSMMGGDASLEDSVRAVINKGCLFSLVAKAEAAE